MSSSSICFSHSRMSEPGCHTVLLRSMAGSARGRPKYGGGVLKALPGGMSRMAKVRRDFSLHALSEDEEATCKSMVEREVSAQLTVMPTHHIDEYGSLNGFRFECGGGSPGSCLPISRRMFFGHTLSECSDGDEAILRLMSSGEENRAKMRVFLERVRDECCAGTLGCIPDNSDALTTHGVMQGTGLRTVDCKRWTPGLPETIGVYHAYIRGFNRDVRAHKLFVGCSGGLETASDEFCNLLIDVGAKWTAKEVCESVETWWLRKASYRARCGLIHGVAQAFGLRVPHIQDIQAHTASTLALSCTDTVEHDLRFSEGVVSVFNGCCDTTQPFNGMVTRMHPGEGLWLFRGASRGGGFGSIFGNRRVCGAFPVSQPQTGSEARAYKHWVRTPASGAVVRLSSAPGAGEAGRHLCFDEAYFRTLERMQWDRDNGYIELMPIVVGVP